MLVIALPHGHDPQFGVGIHEGNAQTRPYPDGWETLHRFYSFTLTLLLCVLLLATNARRSAGPLPSPGATATETETGTRTKVVWVTAVAGVVSVCLVALQMQGTYLVYSTWRGHDPTTGSGLWLATTTVLLAAV